ncbi:kynurenine 3-monooxygenase [Culicoides brevitarsis]|uniref:kynurenine 3-monooxygenase n=1 Tax=Culicoides brevitarsis TaxID=469753 RepID=UPI00307C663A
MSVNNGTTGHEKPHIAVVGAGLVGSLAALQFGMMGHKVDLYEFREDIRTAELVIGRSINLALSKRGRAALRDVGLEETLVTHGLPMRGRMLHDLQGNRKVVPYDHVSNQAIYSVGRKYLNEVLLNAAEKQPNITMHFNMKLVDCDLKNGEMRFMDMRDPAKSVITKSADLIIGADGAFSAVRKQMVKQPGFSYSQTYIDHGYLELCIPATEDGEFAMNENYLHIWPRGQFMMIALPNADKSWTVTLFMPFKNFECIREEKDLLAFFKEYFPDAIELIGEQRLMKDFFKIKAQHLIQVKCSRYDSYGRVLIIGDAAHAMVPFYGQGMNAGMEDVTVLKNILNEYKSDIAGALREFSRVRWEDAHAICDLAMYNYVEMRDLVNKRSFLLRKMLDDFLYSKIGNHWIPLYNTVSFSQIPYRECIANKKRQDKILLSSAIFLVVTLLVLPLIYVLFANFVC